MKLWLKMEKKGSNTVWGGAMDYGGEHCGSWVWCLRSQDPKSLSHINTNKNTENLTPILTLSYFLIPSHAVPHLHDKEDLLIFTQLS